MAKGKGKEGEAQVGHNRTSEEERQNQALFLDHYSKIQKQKEKLDKANSELRGLYKTAKADGFLKREFEYARELVNDEDEKMLQRRRREQQIAKWMGHQIGTQADLFDDSFVDRTPILEKRFDEGFREGAAGRSNQSPFDGEQGQEWLKGWHAGQKSLLDAFEAKNAKPDSTLERTVPPDAPSGEYDDAMDDAGDEVIQENVPSHVDQLREVTGQGEAMQREQIERSKAKSLN